jgi:3-methyladenine DNA glycosylase AlkD
MTLSEAMAELRALGDEKVKAQAYRQGKEASWFGVKLGDIRRVAKRTGPDPALADALWETGNGDARLLAVLLMRPASMPLDKVDRRVREAASPQVADWLMAYVVRPHPERDALRKRWMKDTHPMAARAGWALTADHVEAGADGPDVEALLDRIEAEMPEADPLAQWTMNGALAAIGIHHPEHRDRAVATGERIGLYRDYPVSKGCTSPFAPVWIAEMVRRREGG